MFSAYKKIDKLAEHGRLLMGFVCILVVLNLALIFTLTTSPSRYEFFLTTSMAAAGGEVKVGEVQDENVYSFAAMLMPHFLSWEKSNIDDVKKQMHLKQYYMSPRHLALQKHNIEENHSTGMYERSQTASLYREMEVHDVQRVSKNVWSVHLVLRVMQRLDDTDKELISDKVIDYHVRVARADIPKTLNPYSLVLDGYSEKERLLKDILVGE